MRDVHISLAGSLFTSLQFIAELLDVGICYLYCGAFHFCLAADGWTLAVTPETAGRFRVELCYLSRPRDTKWVHVSDRARLASLVRDAEEMTTVGIC